LPLTYTKGNEMIELYQAIQQVQQNAPTVDKSANNPFFNSKYADLPAIWKAIKDLMGENGLIVVNLIKSTEQGDFITTQIIHAETGGLIESTSKIMLSKSTAQEYGSYITYMRRYALSSMLGLVTDEDDDGNEASKKAPQKAQKEQPKSDRALLTEKLRDQIKKANNLDVLEIVWNDIQGKYADDVEMLKFLGTIHKKAEAFLTESENKDFG
jgi:hypothetical protein